MNLFNRGRITLNRKWIYDNPDVTADILAELRFVPVKIDANPYDGDLLDLYGISPRFRELKEGDTIPTYRLGLLRLGDGDGNGKLNEVIEEE